ncbi:MAG: heat shock protein HslJ [Patiriisocius sp.]|jgi:heat shock protein HslJ
MKQLFLIIIVFCLMASGCNETKKIIADAVETDLVGMYTVITINGGSISPAASLQFNNKDNAISGNSGCNDFGGTYKQDATTIKIGQLVTTKAYCEKVMENEYALLNALKNVTLFDISEGVLTLYSKEDRKALLTAIKKKE